MCPFSCQFKIMTDKDSIRNLATASSTSRCYKVQRCGPAQSGPQLWTVAMDPSVFTIMEKAPSRAFSWLKAPTSTFTFKTLIKTLQLARIRMALPFLSISQPRLHQIQISLRPSCRGGPEDSKTPPTCKVWIILSQDMAI